jgi:hypothetical protein
MNSPSIFRQPSAFIPVVMSLAALATVVTHVAMFGTARQADGERPSGSSPGPQLPVMRHSLSNGCHSPAAGAFVLGVQLTAMVAAAAPSSTSVVSHRVEGV